MTQGPLRRAFLRPSTAPLQKNCPEPTESGCAGLPQPVGYFRRAKKGSQMEADDMDSKQTEAKHTAGPWWVDVHHNILSTGGKLVAFPCVSDGLPQESNARLIAAAPEMLEALCAIVGYSDAPHVEPRKALAFIEQTARAAIAKAVPQ